MQNKFEEQFFFKITILIYNDIWDGKFVVIGKTGRNNGQIKVRCGGLCKP